MFGKHIWCFLKSVLTIASWEKCQTRTVGWWCWGNEWTGTKRSASFSSGVTGASCSLLPVCFLFPSDSWDWVLIARSCLFPHGTAGAWFLCLFYLNSGRATSCLKVLLPWFSKNIEEKNHVLSPPSLACFTLGSTLPAHPCYMLLCLYWWCCEWFMLALGWHQQPATLFFVVVVLFTFRRGGSKA